MSYGAPYPDEYDMIRGVMMRRCFAWLVDVILIGLLMFLLWWIMVLLGVMTLGLGFGLLTLLPFVPFLYHFLSLLGSGSATPGQRMLDLIVRRDEDLGPPTGLQALFTIGAFYLTLATSGLLLLVALFTTRHRTLHDLIAGLVVVRTSAFRALTPPPGYWHTSGGNNPPASGP